MGLPSRIARRYIRSDVSDLDESVLDQVIEDEKERSERDEDRIEEFAEEAKKEFRRISRGPLRERWQEIESEYDDKKTRKKEFTKAIKNSDRVQEFLDTYLGGRDHYVYKFRDVRTDYQYTEKKAVESVGRVAKKFYRNKELDESQEPIREEIPEPIREWLPESLVVEVDEDGTIERISNRFEEKRETIMKKIANVKLVVKKYNDIVEEVKQDLESNDETTRLAALVTSILMETGIRPGSIGNSTIETRDGEEVEVETFGAVTLKPEHVEFVRKNFARLEFRGKKGATNIATMSDSSVMSVLQEYIEDARNRDSDYIFVTRDGEKFRYKDLQDYLNERWSYIAPTDFRKLKATRVTLNTLHDKQQDLYEDIREFVNSETENLKERVAERVSDLIEEALTDAQEALSHQEVRTTIQSYVNPEVVLRFLSRGEIEEDLKDAVLTNDRRLEFDPETFIAHATESDVTSSHRRRQADDKTLKEILESLEASLFGDEEDEFDV